MDNYEKGPTLGEGTFGRVFRATDRRTGRLVAIKKIRMGKAKEGVNVTAIREIKFLKELQHKNVIVRALGMKDSVKVDSILDLPSAGDVYLLCTDGLCGPVTDDEILDITANTSDLDAACKELIDRANQNGGPDNITVVLARIEET